MSQLIEGGAVREDRWTLLRTAASLDELPQGVAMIVPLAFWREHRDALLARGDVGVWLAPADDPAVLATDVAALPLVAVDFPQFTDGRGYSHARLLRSRYGYKGELRAIGDIQRDQLYYLSQSGFDAFLIREGKDAHDALGSLSDFTDGYQLTQVRTPWFRRRAANAANAGDNCGPGA